jgi:hypothetical protein
MLKMNVLDLQQYTLLLSSSKRHSSSISGAS